MFVQTNKEHIPKTVNKNQIHVGNAEEHSHYLIYKHALQKQQQAKYREKLDTIHHCVQQRRQNAGHHVCHNPARYKATNTTNKKSKKHQSGKNRERTADESVDAEAALYIKELHEDWENINIIRPTHFLP